MNIKSLVLLSLCAVVPMLASAKKNKVVEPVAPVEEVPTLTDEECAEKMSLVQQFCKNKQYADAFESWLDLYKMRPDFNKGIYSYGSDILEWKIESTVSDIEECHRWRAVLMESFDKRMQYFGTDAKYPTSYILGEKGLAYVDNFPEDSLKADAREWLRQSVVEMGAKSKLSVLTALMETSYNMFKLNADAYSDAFMADYSLVSSVLQQMADDAANKNAAKAAQQKEYVDNLFAVSGAADCAKLDEINAGKVQESLNSLEDLQKIMKLYRRVKCTESEVYFAAAAASHQLQPTAESAAGCASMCMKKEEWANAIKYYEEAISLLNSTETEDKADYLYNIALIEMDKRHNYAQARSYARQSLEANAAQGRCYILIGMCYAASKPYSGADMAPAKAAILNKTVFWAAVDQFVKAKQVDSSCAEAANKLISSYSKYFPTRDEMFDLPNEFGSGTFTVGGWINERTTCR